MLRSLAPFVFVSLVAGCAASPNLRNVSAPGRTLVFEPVPVLSAPDVDVAEAETSRTETIDLEPAAIPETEPFDLSAFAPATYDTTFDPASVTSAEPSVASAAAPRRRLLGGKYLAFRAGYWSPDTTWGDGSIWTLTYGRYLTKFFALELEGGYFDGSSGGVAISGIPLMVNGRINIPIWWLELYGGGGLGAYYYDIKVAGDGWVAGGNFFLGANLAIFKKFIIGLEGKYYVSDKVGGIAPLDAFAVYLNLGLRL